MLLIDSNTRRKMRRRGFRFGTYDGAFSRQFVLFTEHDAAPRHINRREFTTRKERDATALRLWRELQRSS